MTLAQLLQGALEAVQRWEESWGPAPAHPSTHVDEDALRASLEAYVARLQGNYPFFHPRYAGQMLKPPHPAAVAGYVAAMLINPNNHALDGGPPTSAMEKEAVAQLAAMFNYPADALGHLTSSGTIANLEAVWAARTFHPEKGIAFSDQAHYTHKRLGSVLQIDTHVVPSDIHGRIRLDALEEVVRGGDVGTVVMTAGTTGLGVVDPIGDVVDWGEKYGVRVHVDAAYGGFFVLAAAGEDSPLDSETRRHLNAIGSCDSIVIDPHKHGLQPYGCGCVLFRDPAVGRVYHHDSPYTYFTSDDLHLGEISLECSRAGAAAGALWLTLQLMPLDDDKGLRQVLLAGLRAARDWHERIGRSDALRPYMAPELDIVTYFPEPSIRSTSAVSEASQALFERGMRQSDFYLSVMRVDASTFTRRHTDIEADSAVVQVLRSVLMKPEHELYVDTLHDLVTRAAR